MARYKGSPIMQRLIARQKVQRETSVKPQVTPPKAEEKKDVTRKE